MLASRLAYLFSGRVHYAWVVLAVVFTSTLAGVGVRAAPGVMIVPLQHAFGWDVSTISGAISLNIILLGVTGPFMTGLMQVIGLKRTIIVMHGVADGRHRAVQLHDGALAVVSHLGVDGRDRLRRRRGRHGGGDGEPLVRRRTGFAMGLFTAANAAGQLIFLPVLALLAERYGWRGVRSA